MVKGDGWRIFTATVLGIAGVMRFFDALWAFWYDGALPGDLESALFGRSLSTYGWVYLIVAILLIGSAFGVLSGSQFSRWIGIAAGAVLAVSAVWWMPFYPVWSAVYIAIGMLVVYGMCAYGSREALSQAEADAQRR